MKMIKAILWFRTSTAIIRRAKTCEEVDRTAKKTILHGTRKAVNDWYDYIQYHTVLSLCCNLSETDSSIVSTNGKIFLFGHWYYS